MKTTGKTKTLDRFKWAVGIIAAVALLGFLSCQRNSQSPPKIGANLSLTGSSPYWSQQIKSGLDLAWEQANATNPGKVPVIVYEDNQGDPKNAVTVLQKLINVDHVSAVITAHTPIAKAQRPLAGQSKV